jgi:hypothetical protein
MVPTPMQLHGFFINCGFQRVKLVRQTLENKSLGFIWLFGFFLAVLVLMVVKREIPLMSPFILN